MCFLQLFSLPFSRLYAHFLDYFFSFWLCLMNCWIGPTPPSHDRWLRTLPLMCWKPPMDAACCLNPARSDGGALLEQFTFQRVCAFFHYLYHKCDQMRERIKKTLFPHTITSPFPLGKLWNFVYISACSPTQAVLSFYESRIFSSCILKDNL